MAIYEKYETDISQRSLAPVLRAVPGPACLLGGWAVYLTVNSRYEQETGRPYHGSKDIDLGFHFSGSESPEAIRRSALAESVRILEEAGYQETGGRLYKHYHRETHRPLSADESKKTPLFNIFSMYVDTMVDRVPDGIKDAVGFRPFGESLLSRVFDDNEFHLIEEHGVTIVLPKPGMLLAAKLKSLPERTGDHKRWKDMMDVYALIWYSGADMRHLQSAASELLSPRQAARSLRNIRPQDYETAAAALDVDPGMMKAVVSAFVAQIGALNGRGGAGGGWPIPQGLSLEGVVRVVDAFYRLKACSSPVDIEGVAKKSRFSRQTVTRLLPFFKRTGIVAGHENGTYTLTALGSSYAAAHSSKDAEMIRKASLDVIGGSHLQDLADAIEGGAGSAPVSLYASIKALGGYPDGKGSGGMHPGAGTGAKAVLRMFSDAGLMDSTVTSRGRRGRKGKKSGKAKEENAGGGRNAPSASRKAGSGGAAPPVPGVDGMDHLGVVSVKGVGQIQVDDAGSLDVAESLMKQLRKKVLSAERSPGSGGAEAA